MKVSITFHECSTEEAQRLLSAGQGGYKFSDKMTPDVVAKESARVLNEIIQDHEATPAPSPKKRSKAATPPPPEVLEIEEPLAVCPPPPPPVEQFNAAELELSFPDFMKLVTPRIISKEISSERLAAVMATLGLQGLGGLSARTELIGPALELLK